jgi:hypothetical protein
MSLPIPPKSTYKALLWDYDYLLTKSDDECSYCLSEREVQILLAQIDYIGWKTRYKPTSTEIDQDTIDAWSGNLARKLMSGCCGENTDQIRYLENGTLQVSTDGGETWNDAPGLDPRTNAPLAPPLAGTDSTEKRCAAANNVRDQYLAMRDNTIALLTAGTTALLIVAALVGALGAILSISIVGVTFGVILFSLAGALLSLTPESVEEQIDTTALDAFRCLVYCRMGNDGRLQDDEFDDLLTDIQGEFSGFPETFFYSITASLQEIGINNAATLGAATASDCGGCDCATECGDSTLVVFGIVMATGTTAEGQRYIDINSVPEGGTNVVRYGIIDAGVPPNVCCYLYAHIQLEGSWISSYWTDCDGGGHASPAPETHYLGHCDFYNDFDPFLVRLVFGFPE